MSAPNNNERRDYVRQSDLMLGELIADVRNMSKKLDVLDGQVEGLKREVGDLKALKFKGMGVMLTLTVLWAGVTQLYSTLHGRG